MLEQFSLRCSEAPWPVGRMCEPVSAIQSEKCVPGHGSPKERGSPLGELYQVSKEKQPECQRKKRHLIRHPVGGRHGGVKRHRCGWNAEGRAWGCRGGQVCPPLPTPTHPYTHPGSGKETGFTLTVMKSTK
jgi:hypothetical protein